MSGIFSIEVMIEVTKAKETFWVIAVPEIAKCLTDSSEAFWGLDHQKKAATVVCSGLVGKGALCLDMTPEFSAMLKAALEMLGKRLEEFVTLRVQNKPQAQWEPLARLQTALKVLERGEIGARGKGLMSEVILLGTSDRLMTRNPFGTMVGGGIAGAVRWSTAMMGDRRNMAVFCASVKEAVAVHGLRSAAGCMAAAMLGPASMACETACSAEWTQTAGEIAVKPGADSLPGALWVAAARGDHMWIENRVRMFNNFWDGVGVDQTTGHAFGVVGVARPMRAVNSVPAYVDGTYVYKMDLGTGIVSDALLCALVTRFADLPGRACWRLLRMSKSPFFNASNVEGGGYR